MSILKIVRRFRVHEVFEKKCVVCGKKSPLISSILQVCVDCIRNRFSEAIKYIEKAHEKSRSMFGLPINPPNNENGIKCGLCGCNCKLGLGDVGYCGLVMNKDGKLVRISGGFEWGVLDWYYDPLPTNCVAEWFCPASTGIGYPKYAVKPGTEYGYYNLAVFYGSCSLDCLYCQNWQYRKYPSMARFRRVHVDELVKAADERVTCVCYFGGDPSSQIVHAVLTSRKILERAKNEKRIIRICWETNGQINPHVLNEVIRLSLVSGGIIKIDIKAWSSQVYYALTGRDNRLVIENVKKIAKFIKERPEVPLLTISLLLVPGYVDEYEIEGVCKFVAELNPEIPITFLAFHPDYLMDDLPPTSKRHMDNACKIAKQYGLKYIGIGNEWLLGNYY